MQHKPYLSLYAHAAYVLLTGLTLIFTPNMLIGMFGYPETTEIWIKLFGIVLFSLSIVYYTIGNEGSSAVVQSCMWARWMVAAGFVLMVIAGQTTPALLAFAGIDFASALWTWFELKSKK